MPSSRVPTKPRAVARGALDAPHGHTTGKVEQGPCRPRVDPVEEKRLAVQVTADALAEAESNQHSAGERAMEIEAEATAAQMTDAQKE